MNYLEKLLSSTITTTKDNFKNFKITDSGLYILHPNFDLESISGEKYLKVGMTVESNGLKGRLGTHFTNNEGSTVLGKHIERDLTLEEEFGFDFSERKQRRKFLKQYSYFQVLPLKQFNWTTEEEKKIKNTELRSIERSIENILREKIRYIDDVEFR